jgi:hypothetical protein
VRAILFGAVALPLAFFRAIPWLMKGANSWQRAREKQTTASRTAVAVLITVVLLVVFGALFASADPAFSRIIGDLMPDFTFGTVRRAIVYTALGGLLTAGAVFIVLAPPDLSGLESQSTRASAAWNCCCRSAVWPCSSPASSRCSSGSCSPATHRRA